MDRRAFLGTLAGSVLAAPLAAQTQRAGKVYRVGFLSLGGSPTLTGVWQNFLAGMRELN
jgi:hypothetical protein